MLEGFGKLFKPKDPKELLREWQTKLRAEQRAIDRQIRGAGARRSACTRCLLLLQLLPRCAASLGLSLRTKSLYTADIQFEEKKVRKSITEAAKRSDIATCKVCCRAPSGAPQPPRSCSLLASNLASIEPRRAAALPARFSHRSCSAALASAMQAAPTGANAPVRLP
jgi:hypothetical protein